MQELGLWLQMTKWGNLIKYRICKSICAEDYKGSASLNPQSDISPNGSYINRQWTRRPSLKRPNLHFLKRSLMEWMYVTSLQPPEEQLWTLFSAPDSVKPKYFTGHLILGCVLLINIFLLVYFFYLLYCRIGRSPELKRPQSHCDEGRHHRVKKQKQPDGLTDWACCRMSLFCEQNQLLIGDTQKSSGGPGQVAPERDAESV